MYKYSSLSSLDLVQIFLVVVFYNVYMLCRCFFQYYVEYVVYFCIYSSCIMSLYFLN